MGKRGEHSEKSKPSDGAWKKKKEREIYANKAGLRLAVFGLQFYLVQPLRVDWGRPYSCAVYKNAPAPPITASQLFYSWLRSLSQNSQRKNRACTIFPLAVLNAQTGGQFLLNASMGLNFAAFLAG